MLDDVFRRSRGVTDQSMLTDFPLVLRAENLENCHVIVEDGHIVSHAALWPREFVIDDQSLKAAVIVAVATRPEYRRRGHAARLMRSLQETLQDEAFDLGILWTTVPDFYGKLGWETVVPRGFIVDVDAATIQQRPTFEYELAPFDVEQHLQAAVSLHGQEPVRLTRSRDEARILFRLPKVPVWVAKRDEDVVAYLAHGQATNKRGIAEYGGELGGIMALIHHVVETEPSSQRIPLLLYHPRPDLVAWAKSLKWPVRPLPSSKGQGHEMIYNLRPERVTSQVRDRLFVWGLDQA